MTRDDFDQQAPLAKDLFISMMSSQATAGDVGTVARMAWAAAQIFVQEKVKILKEVAHDENV